MKASKFTERFIQCQHLPNLIGDVTEKHLSLGQLHLARQGICYLNDWSAYNKNIKRTISTLMESKTVALNINSTFDCVHLQCAIWSYFEINNKKKTMGEIQTLSK